MATQTVDEQVLELLNKIKTQKQEVEALSKRPKWITNCVFSYLPSSVHGSINIMTVTDIESLLDIYAFLSQKKDSIKKYGEFLSIEDLTEPTHLGYTITDWLKDVQTRIESLQVDKKKNKINDLDKRVNKLVSAEQRRVLELEALKKELDVK